jgi:hypothetical protein
MNSTRNRPPLRWLSYLMCLRILASGAIAYAQARPDSAACLEWEIRPPPDGRSIAQVAQARGNDPRCCSGKVDDHGQCTFLTTHKCGDDRKCEGKRSCLDGRCCAVPNEDCSQGAKCCPGLECKNKTITVPVGRGQHPQPKTIAQCDFVKHSAFGVGGSPIGSRCTGPYECVTEICKKGKCVSSCIAAKEPCGLEADTAIGLGCCQPAICLETKPKSGKYACRPVGSGGCNPAGYSCSPYAKRGSEGSAGNNCCGVCGADNKCHDVHH